MHQYLHKYLVLNQKLSLPDIGNLIIEPNIAQLDVNNGLLFAPVPSIHFKQDFTTVADKYFYDFLAEEMGLDEMTAIKNFHDYLNKIKAALITPVGANIPGIGNLRKEQNEFIRFTAEKNLYDLMPQVKVENAQQLLVNNEVVETDDDDRILTNQEEQEIRELLGQETQDGQTDYWWVYAVILLLIGVGALLFYYG